MDIIIDDIKNFCCCSESSKGGALDIMYLEMISSDDPEEIARIKTLTRDLAIDAIVDDKVEEYENRKESLNNYGNIDFEGFASQNTNRLQITPVFRKLRTLPKKFVSYADCYNEILDHIELSTNISNQPDITYLPTLTYSEFGRRLLSKMVMCSNIIAQESRRGLATTILVGTDILKYLDTSYFTPFENEKKYDAKIVGMFSGFTVITSDRISPDKVIVLRSHQSMDSAGLIFIENKRMSQYYFTQTDKTFDKMFKYFRVN